ncbi:MAG: TerB family tellurite resistance protein [Deltaproteobacteria bacterium]|nr:MAG: TerB family tellurite resistance protein [Deltaproteobacteria bacterium]
MLDQLGRDDRLRLMKFVCSFAWADLKIRPEERAFVTRMIGRLELDSEERRQVEAWLKMPPSPEGIDPTTIPLAHRKTFVECIEGIISADGEVSAEERENLSLFMQLLS